MTITVVSENEAAYTGYNPDITPIPASTLVTQTGVRIIFGSNAEVAGNESLIDDLGTDTWQDLGQSLRFFANFGRPAGGQAEYWGGAPVGLVLFEGPSLTTLESRIDDFVSANNAYGASSIFIRKSSANSIEIFSKSFSTNLTHAGVTINASGRYGISVSAAAEPTRSQTITLEAGVVTEDNLDVGSTSHNTTTLTDIRLSVVGEVDVEVAETDSRVLIFNAPPPNPTANGQILNGEIIVEAGATLRLSGAVRTFANGARDFLRNLRVIMARISQGVVENPPDVFTYPYNSYAGDLGGLKIYGDCIITSLDYFHANPITVYDSGLLRIVGSNVSPIATEAEHGSGNRAEVAVFGRLETDNATNRSKVSCLRAPVIDGLTQLIRDFIVQNRIGSGDDTFRYQIGFIGDGGARWSTFGAPRQPLRNGLQGSSLPITGTTNDEPHTDVGTPFYQDLNIEVRDSNGVIIPDAVASWGRTVPAGTPNTLNYRNKTTDQQDVFLADLNTAADYAYRTGANGQTGNQLILIAAFVVNDAAHGGNVMYRFLSDGSAPNPLLQGNDIQAVSIKSFGNKPATVNIQIRPRENRQARLEVVSVLPDPTILHTKLEAEVFNSRMTIDHETETITIHENFVDDNGQTQTLYWYWDEVISGIAFNGQLSANTPYPTHGTLAAIVDGEIMRTNYHIVINGDIITDRIVMNVISTKTITIGTNGANNSLYEYTNPAGDRVCSYSFYFNVLDFNAAYTIKFYGLDTSDVETLIFSKSTTGTSIERFEIDHTLYEHIVYRITSPELIEVEQQSLSQLLQRSISVVSDVALVILSSWRFDANELAKVVTHDTTVDPITNIAADTIAFVGAWDTATTYDRLVYGIRLMAHTAGLPLTNFVEIIDNRPVIKKRISNLGGLSVIFDTTTTGHNYDGITIHADDEAFLLTHNFGVNARAGTKSTLRINALKTGDVLFLEKSTSVTDPVTNITTVNVTIAETVITANGTHTVIVDLGSTYTYRIYRFGFTHAKTAITSDNETPFFRDIVGYNPAIHTPTGLTISDYLTFPNGKIILGGDLRTTSERTHTAINRADSFWLEAQRDIIRALGMDALNFVVRFADSYLYNNIYVETHNSANHLIGSPMELPDGTKGTEDNVISIATKNPNVQVHVNAAAAVTLPETILYQSEMTSAATGVTSFPLGYNDGAAGSNIPHRIDDGGININALIYSPTTVRLQFANLPAQNRSWSLHIGSIILPFTAPVPNSSIVYEFSGITATLPAAGDTYTVKITQPAEIDFSKGIIPIVSSGGGE